MLVSHLGHDGGLELVRQVCEHVLLEPAQDKGAHGGAQAGRSLLVPADDGLLIAATEALVAAKEAGHQEVEDAPELGQAVLDRGARQRETVLGREHLDRPRRERLLVFDVLGLIEHDAEEALVGIVLHVATQEVIARDQDLVPGLGQDAAALWGRAGHHGHVHLRGKLGKLRLPVVDERGGANDEGPPAAAARKQKGDQLGRLAEAHLVGEDAAKSHVRERREPLEALALVAAQLDGQARRQLVGGGVHAAEIRDPLVEGGILLVVADHVVQQEGLVGGHLHDARGELAGREPQFVGQIGRLGEVEALEVKEAAVAQAVITLLLPVAPEQGVELIKR